MAGFDIRKKVAVIVVSAACIAGIAGFEGFRSKAYKDPTGTLTIGYGETKGVKKGDTITEPEARKLLEKSANQYANAIRQCVKVPLYQHEFSAFLDFTYNAGAANFCGSTMVKKLNRGDYTGACNELPKWVYSKGVKMPGLVKRRNAEKRLCLGEITEEEFARIK